MDMLPPPVQTPTGGGPTASAQGSSTRGRSGGDAPSEPGSGSLVYTKLNWGPSPVVSNARCIIGWSDRKRTDRPVSTLRLSSKAAVRGKHRGRRAQADCVLLALSCARRTTASPSASCQERWREARGSSLTRILSPRHIQKSGGGSQFVKTRHETPPHFRRV